MTSSRKTISSHEWHILISDTFHELISPLQLIKGGSRLIWNQDCKKRFSLKGISCWNVIGNLALKRVKILSFVLVVLACSGGLGICESSFNSHLFHQSNITSTTFPKLWSSLPVIFSVELQFKISKNLDIW